jgi:UTP-glucose-1-phosphate uridylyltransferase
MKPTLLILAAGIGSRYGSLKQLDAIGPSGETIIDYSIYDAINSGFDKVVFVIRENIEKEFKDFFGKKLKNKIKIEFVHQELSKIPEGISWPTDREKPWGTGHAVLMAADRISGPFAVINADDFYGRGAFRLLADYYENWSTDYENDYCMVGYDLRNTLSDHGSVSRGICKADRFSNLVEITEQTHVERTGKGIAYKDPEGKFIPLPDESLVSMNFWGFTPSIFRYLNQGFREFLATRAMDPKAEFYIPSVVNSLVKSKRASVKILNCHDQWFGMTYTKDRDQVVSRINGQIEDEVYPEKLWG